MDSLKARRRFCIWLAALLCLCAAALIMPHVTPHDPIASDLLHVNRPPGTGYPLGTDSVGRCVACRVMAGLGTTLFSAFAIAGLSFVAGSLVGAVSGYLGGWVDAVVMRVVDAFMAFPSLVLSIAVAGLLGGGLANAVIALAVVDWTRFARLARAQVLSVKTRTFVMAERVGGLSVARIAVVHVLPNILPPLVVTACLDVGGMMLNLAGLSFLGLGAAPPAPELGSMVNQAAATFQVAPWAVLAPGGAILVSVMVLNMFGDAANDLLMSGGSRVPRRRGGVGGLTVRAPLGAGLGARGDAAGAGDRKTGANGGAGAQAV